MSKNNERIDESHSNDSHEEHVKKKIKTTHKDKEKKKEKKKDKNKKKEKKKHKKSKKDKSKKEESEKEKSKTQKSSTNDNKELISNEEEQTKNNIKENPYYIPLSISSKEEKQELANKEELRKSFKNQTEKNDKENNDTNTTSKGHGSTNLANVFQEPEATSGFKLFESDESSDNNEQTDAPKPMNVEAESSQIKKPLAPWDKTVLKRKRAETFGFEWDHGVDKNQLLQREGGLPFFFPSQSFHFAIGHKFKTTESRKARYANFKKQKKKLRGFVSMRRNAGLQHKRWLNEKQKAQE